MTPQDKAVLQHWNRKILKEINITLRFSDDEKRSNALKEFCDNISFLQPKFIVKKEKIDGKPPAIKIGDSLYFHAVPLGPELDPFLEIAIFHEELSENLSESIQGRLAEVRTPTVIKLFITPQCPFCPSAVRKLAPLTVCKYVRLQIIDGTMFPEIAESDGIQSAPTIVLDDFRWTGSVPLEEIIDILSRRDPAQLSSATFRSMIQEGNAMLVAQLILENRIFFPDFIDVLADIKWSVRLGAMVVVEEIIEHDPEFASQIIPLIWRIIPSLEKQIKGDMLYLVGEAGTSDTIQELEDYIDETSNDELNTIAREAIESIMARQK